MSTKQREQDGAEHQERARVESLIAATVLRTLGRPERLRTVQVRRVWGDSFRVNVLTGDEMSATIAHSFFLTTDGAGEILEASPAIAKRY